MQQSTLDAEKDKAVIIFKTQLFHEGRLVAAGPALIDSELGGHLFHRVSLQEQVQDIALARSKQIKSSCV